MSKNVTQSTFISDLKALFKAGVLLSNVLPVVTGFWLAVFYTGASFGEHWPIFLLTVIGSTFVMAGALVINNWYDVDIDAIMARTKNRPTVTGHFPLHVVLIIGIIITFVGFVLMLFTTIEATMYAFIGWVTYVFFYTMWSKRRYTINTVIGSVSGAVTPLIGWAALEPAFHPVPIVTALLLFIWQMPHTYAIAIRKYEEYKTAGVAMLPVVYGFQVTKVQIVIYIACLLPLPFFLMSLGPVFVVLASLLNIGWLVAAIRGFYSNDIVKWANVIFLYSVNYLLIIYILMIVVTLPF